MLHMQIFKRNGRLGVTARSPPKYLFLTARDVFLTARPSMGCHLCCIIVNDLLPLKYILLFPVMAAMVLVLSTNLLQFPLSSFSFLYELL